MSRTKTHVIPIRTVSMVCTHLLYSEELPPGPHEPIYVISELLSSTDTRVISHKKVRALRNLRGDVQIVLETSIFLRAARYQGVQLIPGMRTTSAEALTMISR